MQLAQSPRFLSSPAASFRFTELLWQYLKPIMSIDQACHNFGSGRVLMSRSA